MAKADDTHGWTQERRARQAILIHNWKPWISSTGPRTAAGKARSAQNADRPQSINRRLRDLRQLVKKLQLQAREIAVLRRL